MGNEFFQIKFFKIVFVGLICLLFFSLFAHKKLLNSENDNLLKEQRSTFKFESYENFNAMTASDLKYRIEEMLRMKVRLFSANFDLLNF